MWGKDGQCPGVFAHLLFLGTVHEMVVVVAGAPSESWERKKQREFYSLSFANG